MEKYVFKDKGNNMEEILKKMENISELKEKKIELEKEKEAIINEKKELRKLNKEKELMLITDQKRKEKEEEIEIRDNNNKKLAEEVKKKSDKFNEVLENYKKELLETIEEKKKNKSSNEEIDKIKKEIENNEKIKLAYARVAKNAERTAEKARKKIENGESKYEKLLKSAQEEKEARLINVMKVQKRIDKEEKELAELMNYKKDDKECTDLKYLYARIANLSYSNFDNILNDQYYQENKKEENDDLTNKIDTQKENLNLKIDDNKDEEPKVDVNNNIVKDPEINEDMTEEGKNLKTNSNVIEEKENISEKNINKFNTKKIPWIDRQIHKKGYDRWLNNEDKENIAKISKIEILENEGKVIAYDENGLEINKCNTLKHNFRDIIDKKVMYLAVKCAMLSNGITTSKKETKKLMKKLNPSVLKALNGDKEMLKQYLISVSNEQALPFELVYDLKGMNPVMKFYKEKGKQIKKEEKQGAKIMNKLFDKSRTLNEGEKRVETLENELNKEQPKQIKNIKDDIRNIKRVDIYRSKREMINGSKLEKGNSQQNLNPKCEKKLEKTNSIDEEVR